MSIYAPGYVPDDKDDLIRWLRQEFPRLARILNAGPQGVAVPASASSAGTPGQVAWDASYFYVCVATNTWKRTALSTF